MDTEESIEFVDSHEDKRREAPPDISNMKKIKEPFPKVCWQSIIVFILGAVIIIYAAAAPNVEETKRVFSIVMMLLWSILWGLVLWIFWRDGKLLTSWLVMIVPIVLMILFFVLAVILNIDPEI